METTDSSPSFEKDIRPLFSSDDIDHMAAMGVLLDDYQYMSDPGNAQAVYDYLAGALEPRMPPGGPYWTDEQLDLFSTWMKSGRRS